MGEISLVRDKNYLNWNGVMLSLILCLFNKIRDKNFKIKLTKCKVEGPKYFSNFNLHINYKNTFSWVIKTVN